MEAWAKVYVGYEFVTDVHNVQNCIGCHGGVAEVEKVDEAHEGVVRDPLEESDRACRVCHTESGRLVQTSLHQNLTGYHTALEARGADLSDPAMQEAFANHCDDCHATCGQCQISRPTALGGGLLREHTVRATASMKDTCMACHGARVANEYQGKNEGEVAGHLTIGCTTTAGKYVLPILAASFNQQYPNVQVKIEMCQCETVKDPLLARDVHVGISDTRIVHRDMDCQPFYKDQIVLIAHVDHPFAERSSVDPRELCDQPFILREEGCSTCQMLEEALSAQQVRLDQLQVVMSVGNSEAIEMAVEHGLGIAFISRLAAIGGIESGRLAEVPVEGLHLERQLHAVRSLRYSKTPAEAALWDFIREHREEIAQTL